MRIAVIAGPPCAGKTTFADAVRRPDDMVLDFDDIARAFGSPVRWIHPEPWRAEAERVMNEAIARAHLMHGPGTAWVIRAAPRTLHRQRLAATWNARVYVLNPGEAECRRRARADNRPTGTGKSIGEWFARYMPWIGDRDPAELDPRWTTTPTVDRGVVTVDPRDV